MRAPEWLKHPKWKWMRPPLGFALILLGCFGFLPVLGFWMIPLGLAVLAVDFPAAERASHWLEGKWKPLETRLRALWRKRSRAQE